MNNIMTELQAALRAAGHGAEEVQNSPADMLNVWLNDEGRTPSATVLYEPGEDFGTITWGHHWEHSASTAIGAGNIAQQIIESITSL